MGFAHGQRRRWGGFAIGFATGCWFRSTKLLAFLEASCGSRRGTSPLWKSINMVFSFQHQSKHTFLRFLRFLKAWRLLDHLHPLHLICLCKAWQPGRGHVGWGEPGAATEKAGAASRTWHQMKHAVDHAHPSQYTTLYSIHWYTHCTDLFIHCHHYLYIHIISISISLSISLRISAHLDLIFMS